MRGTRRAALAGLLGLAVLAVVPAAGAFDGEQTFHQGAYLLSIEGGGGSIWNHEHKSNATDLEMWNAGIRLSAIPWGPMGPGLLRGAIEIGLEPFFQRYTHATQAYFAGLGGAARYHFLGFGPVVPYAEVFLAAGGTNLRIPEIDSTFTFLMHAGAGVSVFLTDRIAVYGGYRLQHVSNANTASPNRGLESHTGVGGVSYYFK